MLLNISKTSHTSEVICLVTFADQMAANYNNAANSHKNISVSIFANFLADAGRQSE